MYPSHMGEAGAALHQSHSTSHTRLLTLPPNLQPRPRPSALSTPLLLASPRPLLSPLCRLGSSRVWTSACRKGWSCTLGAWSREGLPCQPPSSSPAPPARSTTPYRSRLSYRSTSSYRSRPSYQHSSAQPLSPAGRRRGRGFPKIERAALRAACDMRKPKP